MSQAERELPETGGTHEDVILHQVVVRPKDESTDTFAAACQRELSSGAQRFVYDERLKLLVPQSWIAHFLFHFAYR